MLKESYKRYQEKILKTNRKNNKIMLKYSRDTSPLT